MAAVQSPVIVRTDHVKPTLPLLKTPLISGYSLPSATPRSPRSGNTFLKVEPDLKTPITPPSAYTDFLKALSPGVSTPLTATSAHSSFSFTFSDRSGHLTPISQPQSAQPHYTSYRKEDVKRPEITSMRSAPLVPPTQFVRPGLARSSTTSAKTARLRKLRIPQSPYSDCSEESLTPRSAGLPRSMASPRSATPRSSAKPRSPFSPSAGWVIEGKTKIYHDSNQAGRPRSMSVKQVVTRTVTYIRTPLEPAPKGKRRKLDE